MSDQFRPSDWDSYIGQNKLKEHLQIKIAGVNEREEPLPHVLLVGTPGCGKTTLAALIAQELQVPFLSYVMPIKPAVLQKIVRQFEGVVLFDEIHRIPAKQEEDLLPLIEDDYLQLTNGIRLYTGNLTIVGATTKPKEMDAALWERFEIKPGFEDYTDNEMGLIVQGMAQKVGLNMSHETAVELGRATGGIPRHAKHIVGMALDLKTMDTALILEKCGLTKDGLTLDHIHYLNVLGNAGAPVGIDLISAHLQQPKSIILDLERLLVKRNMIEQTKQGRGLLTDGYAAIDVKVHF